MDIYNFHVESFFWIILYHGENFAQSCEKKKKFPTLRKISKFRNFNFSKWNIEFFFLMNKFYILTCFDELWSLTFDFDQKVKVWLFSVQLTFDQLTENSLLILWTWVMFWTMLLGKNDAIIFSRSWLQPIDHLLGQKSEIALSQSKP